MSRLLKKNPLLDRAMPHRSMMSRSLIGSRMVRQNQTIVASKTPPLSKPPLTLADSLGLTYVIIEGVAKNFQAIWNSPVNY